MIPTAEELAANGTRFVLVTDEMVATLKAAPLVPVTVKIEELPDGQLHMLFTRYDERLTLSVRETSFAGESVTTIAEAVGWSMEPVRIHCDPKTGSEWRERDGWVHLGAPGLAVTRCETWDSGPSESAYCVTHLQTGMRIGGDTSFENAKRRALMFGVIGGFDTDDPYLVRKKSQAWGAVARLIAASDKDWPALGERPHDSTETE